MDPLTTNTDPTASGASTDPSSNGTTPPAPKLYTKEEHTATIQRETAKERAARAAVEQQLADREAKLAEYEAKAREAEEAKLNATQRAELERRREREKLEAERETWKATAEKERTLRHGALTTEASTRLIAATAAQFWSADLARDAARDVREHVVVQPDAQDNDVVAWQHAPGDVVPLEEGFKAFVAAGSLARFMRVEGGSGARHGSGAGGGGPKPTSLADALLQQQQNRR